LLDLIENITGVRFFETCSVVVVLCVQGMMTCPLCFGAFSWKEDLLHHLGSVHHLEELVAHLDSEFASETCPPCCWVPRTLFKSLLQVPACSVPSSVTNTDSAQCAPGNQLSTTESSHVDVPVRKMHQSDGTQGKTDHSPKKLDNTTSPRCKLSDICVKSIERYHCDLCEFSANDLGQLLEHGSEHESQKTRGQPASDGLEHSSEHESQKTRGQPASDGHFAAVIEETDDDRSNVSPRKQVNETFSCDFCPFSTKLQHVITRHVQIHERSALVKNGYKCAYCNMARITRGAIRFHQTACHHDQPIKILCIGSGKVVKDSHNSVKSAGKSCSVVKKQRKLKLSKSKFVTVKSQSCASQETNVIHKQATSALSLNAGEMLSCEKEGSTKALESKLPAQMVYATPVRCPLCDFRNRARLNLVRHIRLTHGNHHQSETQMTSHPSSVCATNCGNVDRDKPASLLQV